MSKKNNPLDDYQKIKNEMVVDAVNEVFRKHPDKYIKELEEIGFKYYEEEDTELIEENNASPENERQEYIVAYFEGKHELSDKILQAYLDERGSDSSNFPLIRKFFRKANPQLKNLLLYGLDQDPVNIELLSDLSFFHEFSNILEVMVNRFVSACHQEQNLLNFQELIQQFYYSTEPDVYDVISRLKEMFPADTEKGRNVEFFSSELTKQKDEPDDIEL